MTDFAQIRNRLDRYKQFLAADPRNTSLLAEVAELRMQLGDFDGARAALDTALGLSPTHPGLRSQRAVLAIASSRPEEAVELLQGLIADGVDAPAVRYNFGYALMFTGKHREAADQFLAVSTVADAPSDTSLMLARALHHLGDLDGAMQHAKTHLEKHPNDAAGLGYMALLSLDSTEMTAAKEYAEKALASDGDNSEALVVLGSFALEHQDEAVAKENFEQVLARRPNNGRAWSGLALSEMLALNIDRAKECLGQALQYMPEHIGTWHVLGWCQIVTEDLAGAQATFAKALAMDRNFGETHGGVAVVAVLQGRVKEAEEAMRRALKLDPKSFAGRFAQSLLLAHAGNPQAAQALVQRILRSRVTPEGQPLEETLAKFLRTRKVLPIPPAKK